MLNNLSKIPRTLYINSILILRFGLVPCIQAMHDIAAGEEIFVWYGYDLDYCPEWYMEAWALGNFAVPDSMKKEYGE